MIYEIKKSVLISNITFNRKLSNIDNSLLENIGVKKYINDAFNKHSYYEYDNIIFLVKDDDYYSSNIFYKNDTYQMTFDQIDEIIKFIKMYNFYNENITDIIENWDIYNEN